MPRRDIVAVIGTTGVGKSQFAVDLARSLETPSIPHQTLIGSLDSRDYASSQYRRATILSADSMQLYEGLPIITNKVTPDEMQGVEHWGLNVVKPGQGGSWEIGRWCHEASKEVDSLPEDCLPIICGGTHYYTQHFLFPPSALSQIRSSDRPQAKPSSGTRWEPRSPLPTLSSDFDRDLIPFLQTFHLPSPTYPTWVSSGSSSPLDGQKAASNSSEKSSDQLLAQWKLLEAVDPAEAGRWHWRDGRKVKRGIERWWERRAGEEAAILRDGEAIERGSGVDNEVVSDSSGQQDGTARFRTLIFWVYDDMESISPRLDKRVDRMVDLGLLEEVRDLRALAKEIYGEDQNADYQEGIFQSIGYKEFAAIPTSTLTADQLLFRPALDRMKLSTRQYAKSQLKWIRKQLLPAVARARRMAAEQATEGDIIEVYAVRGGEADCEAGISVLKAFLGRTQMPDPSHIGHPATLELLSSLRESTRAAEALDIGGRQVANAQQVCEVCSTSGNPVSIIQGGWEAHVASKGHRRRKNKEGEQERDTRIAHLRAEASARKAAKGG